MRGEPQMVSMFEVELMKILGLGTRIMSTIWPGLWVLVLSWYPMLPPEFFCCLWEFTLTRC